MKKTIITMAVVVATLNSLAQLGSFDKQSFDNNGVPLDNTFIDMKAPGAVASILTTYTYDSIRPLTEINNSINGDGFPWISTDGLRLYYTNGNGGNNLMFTQRSNTDSYFLSPTLLPISISSPWTSWFSSDELDIYICTSTNLYFAHRNTVTSSFNTPVLINLTGPSLSYIKSASLNFAQNRLFLYSGTLGIVEFSRTSSTSFSYIRTLPTPLNYINGVGQLSKDELTFFFGATSSAGKSKLFQFTRATPLDSFNISTLQEIQGINDTSILINAHPSMSNNLEWVAFTRANQNLWNFSDLFITHNGSTTSVFNPSEKKLSISIFPNPSSGKLTVKMDDILDNEMDGVIEIYNVLGETIYFNSKFRKQTLNEIDLSNSPKGIYFLKIYVGQKKRTEKIIIQ